MRLLVFTFIDSTRFCVLNGDDENVGKILDNVFAQKSVPIISIDKTFSSSKKLDESLDRLLAHLSNMDCVKTSTLETMRNENEIDETIQCMKIHCVGFNNNKTVYCRFVIYPSRIESDILDFINV